jgi:hypothetical protein
MIQENLLCKMLVNLLTLLIYILNTYKVITNNQPAQNVILKNRNTKNNIFFQNIKFKMYVVIQKSKNLKKLIIVF